MKLRGEQEVSKHLYYRRRELEKDTEDQLKTITKQSLEDTDSLKALTDSTQEGLL